MCSLFALLTVFDRFPRLLPIDLLLYNPGLLNSHLACSYPPIRLNECVQMLSVPILRDASRRFRISKRVKNADEDGIVVSSFHEREGAKAWHMIQQGDKALLHTLDKLLACPWHESV
jgi:hypothetical protein